MAGWLAWNLRIITVAAVACFSYYGADYWSSRNKHESIEKTDFKEFQELDEVKHLSLGDKKPDIARKYLEKTNINKASGGTARGLNDWIEKMNKECEEKPYLHINGSDLINRRYCRLYWSVEEDINVLIKAENKVVLLSSTDNEDNDEWKNKWGEYNKTSPWGTIAEEENGKVPSKFKDLCQEKAKESVYDVDNDKYIDVTKYCTREKTIKDAVKERGYKLLKKEEDSEQWQKNLQAYNQEKIGVRFKKGTKTDQISEFQAACEETSKFKTNVEDYKNFRGVLETYCSIKMEDN